MRQRWKAVVLAAGSVTAINSVGRAQPVFLNTISTAGAGAGQVTGPLSVTVAPNGQEVALLGYDSPSASGSAVYQADGTFLFGLTTGDNGNAPAPGTSFESAIGPDGTFYVGNINGGWTEFNSSGEGEIRQVVGTGIVTLGLAFNNASQNLYIAQEDVSGIQVYQANGTSTGQTIGSVHYGAVALNSGDSILFAGEISADQIDMFDMEGNSLGSFGSGVLSGSASGLAVSGTGRVYVADGDTVKAFDPVDGSYVYDPSASISTLPGGGALGGATGVAVGPTGYIYVVDGLGTPTVDELNRYFDPSQWVSGTNSFTNSETGPTSVGVGSGSGDILGTNFTLNSSMGLVVGDATTVENGGTFNVSGGSLNTNSLVVDGTNGGANFTLSGGSLATSSISVTGGGVADVAGPGVSINLPGSVSVSGSGSQFKVDQGAVFSSTGLTNTGGQVVLGTNADFIVYASAANDGAIDLAGGELDVRGTLTNNSDGTIQGNGTLSTTAGLVNNGGIALSGTSEVLGAVTNSGAIEISGIQPTVFFSTVTNNATILVNPGASATFEGGITGSAPTNTVNIGAGSLATLAAPLSTIASLTVAGSPGVWTGQLDLKNNTLLINYGSGSDPVSTIRSYLASGYNDGAWNGFGIESSSAAASGGRYGLGYADSADPGNPAGLSSGTIEIKYTLYGDTNLDGTVNSIDFGTLAANFGKSGKVWDQGDFNYDGTVNSVDFGLLAANFGKSASGADVALPSEDWAALDAFAAANGLMADVPEPASGGLAILTGLGMLSARRRRR